jgi:hypothetical protein
MAFEAGSVAAVAGSGPVIVHQSLKIAIKSCTFN